MFREVGTQAELENLFMILQLWEAELDARKYATAQP